MDALLTWGSAGTLAVATALTLLIVQYVKPLSFLQNINTRIIAYIVALVLLLCATAFTTPAEVSSYFLAVFNAFIVAAAAVGTYQVTFKTTDQAKKAL